MIHIPALISLLHPAPINNWADDYTEISYARWVIEIGRLKYQALYEDEEFIRKLGTQGYGPNGQLTLLQFVLWNLLSESDPQFNPNTNCAGFIHWFYRQGVEKYGLWPFLGDTERQLILAQGNYRMPQLSVVMGHPRQVGKTRSYIPRFGANLIGYVFGHLGIGEDIRMAGRALLASAIPFRMLDFPPGSNAPQFERSMEQYVRDIPDYTFNIFCMTAEENGRYYAHHGRQQFIGHYNIGYWPWELGNWPKEWEQLLDLVDEVWVSTKHTYAALEPICTKPLRIMPMAVELGPLTTFSSRAQARKNFSLPEDATLFCFSFDLNSWMQRKNPSGCIEAFLKAFPRHSPGKKTWSEKDVGLVIKAHRPTDLNTQWEGLKVLAAIDPRIHIIEGTLQRPDLLALYKSCDCFLSLHRAEGFGRGLAEAMQLGLHVICTGYSGNVDFCKNPYADLVRYKLTPLAKDDYVQAEGQVWAEPDVEHAAELMRSFVERPRRRRRQRWKEFSPAEVGKRYKKRLLEIWGQLEGQNRALQVEPAKLKIEPCDDHRMKPAK